MRTGGECDAF